MVDDSGQYEIVKNAILKAYELVPEAYRQKFRNTVKSANQTHVEFARHKENLIDRWCMSNTIENNFEKLRQLILVEEFKNCVPSEVRTYLDEKKADTLSQAAILADDYVLTHKNSFNHRPVGSSQKSDSHVRPNNYNFKGTPRNGSQSSRLGNKMASFPIGPECYHSRKKGHVMADCWYLKGSGHNNSAMRSNMLVANAQPQGLRSQPPVETSTASRPNDEYTPFISTATVSSPGSRGVWNPIIVLRNTGASQSLLLRSRCSPNAV